LAVSTGHGVLPLLARALAFEHQFRDLGCAGIRKPDVLTLDGKPALFQHADGPNSIFGPSLLGPGSEARRCYTDQSELFDIGNVRLHALISKEGTIQDLKVVSGHPLLVPCALEAVKQWAYQPTLLNGEPVEVETDIDVNFTLSQ
jgi:hypothetical protein